jgi:hypothetical protein
MNTTPLKFHAPSQMLSTLILPLETVILDVLDLAIKDVFDPLNIDFIEWNANEYREISDDYNLGRPTKRDVTGLRGRAIASVAVKGDPNSPRGFISFNIFTSKGGSGGTTFGVADCVGVELRHWDLGDDTESSTHLAFERHLTLFRVLARHFPVLRGAISRYSGEYAPIPPYYNSRHMLFVADRADVNAAYEHPDQYWSAWDTQETLPNDRVLLTKGTEIYDELAYKMAIYPRAWELARDAKPRQTKYEYPDPQDYDMPFYNAGAERLNLVGYHTEEQYLEYSAFVPEGEHIQPGELMTLAAWLMVHKVSDGKPLKEIRVRFPNRAMADREKRPLLDAGFRVFCNSPIGWEEIAV